MGSKIEWNLFGKTLKTKNPFIIGVTHLLAIPFYLLMLVFILLVVAWLILLIPIILAFVVAAVILIIVPATWGGMASSVEKLFQKKVIKHGRKKGQKKV